MNTGLQYPLIFLVIVLCIGCGQNSESVSNSSNDKKSIPDFSSINTSNVQVYKCDNSLKFTVHAKQDSAWLFLPDTTLKVMSVSAGSGARYEADSYLYWSKDREALLQFPTGGLMNCELIPQKSSWHAARLRGVDFRAIGQEPGWILEIRKGQQIKFIGDYGEDTLITSAPKPNEQKSEVTVYETGSNGKKIQIRISPQSCQDAMSGFQFPSTVNITKDGKSYSGCGKYLEKLPVN